MGAHRARHPAHPPTLAGAPRGEQSGWIESRRPTIAIRPWQPCRHSSSTKRRACHGKRVRTNVATKKTKGSPARDEQVGASPDGHETRQGGCAEAAALTWHRHAARVVIGAGAAGQRIPVVVQSAEMRAVAPGLLDELELT